jgi:hypothetical protein
VRDLRISDGIRQLIGEQRYAEFVAGPYPAMFRCRVCGAEGTVDEHSPVTAGLEVYPRGQLLLYLQHAHHGPAGIQLGDGTGVDLNFAATAYGIVIGRLGPDGPWPAMVVEIPQAVVEHQGDGTVDYASNTLCGMGMQPVGRVDAEPPPPTRTRWRVDTRRNRVVARVAGEQLSLLEPLPPMPPEWLALVKLRHGQLGLYVATRLGMPAITRDEIEFHRLLDAAAAAGRVVGTTAVFV